MGFPDTCHYNEIREYIEDCKQREVSVRLQYLRFLKVRADQDYQLFLEVCKYDFLEEE